MNTLDAIKARHSSRGFTDRQISDADLETILFAGGQAAVGGADFKSMKLYAVQDPELLKAIDEASGALMPRLTVRLPCGSASTSKTRSPALTNPAPRLTVETVFPTPPF